MILLTESDRKILTHFHLTHRTSDDMKRRAQSCLKTNVPHIFLLPSECAVRPVRFSNTKPRNSVLTVQTRLQEQACAWIRQTNSILKPSYLEHLQRDNMFCCVTERPKWTSKHHQLNWPHTSFPVYIFCSCLFFLRQRKTGRISRTSCRSLNAIVAQLENRQFWVNTTIQHRTITTKITTATTTTGAWG